MTTKLALVIAAIAASVYSQSTVFVFFPIKDGSVTPDSCSGGTKVLCVDDRTHSVGWIVFNLQGVNVRNLSSAILVLPVKSVKASGTCGVHELMTAVAEPENRVTASNLHFDDLPIASIAIDNSFTGRMILLNVGDQVHSRSFKGIVLRSMKACSVEFNSRESIPSPALLCTYDQYDSPRVKWWSGSGRPDSSVGMQGDFYAEMGKGVIFRKSSASWDSLATLIPPQPKVEVVKKFPKAKRPVKKKAASAAHKVRIPPDQAVKPR